MIEAKFFFENVFVSRVIRQGDHTSLAIDETLELTVAAALSDQSKSMVYKELLDVAVLQDF
jgi:hypothetical protein